MLGSRDGGGSGALHCARGAANVEGPMRPPASNSSTLAPTAPKAKGANSNAGLRSEAERRVQPTRPRIPATPNTATSALEVADDISSRCAA